MCIRDRLYTTDILCHPETVVRLGEIFMLRLQELAPDCIMTVETSGIPLAMQTARAFNVPLVIARHTSDITEGSTVNINYVSGSTKVIQNMAMPKRALQPGSRVLIVDDVMKGGGTAKGMIEMCIRDSCQRAEAGRQAYAPTHRQASDYNNSCSAPDA